MQLELALLLGDALQLRIQLGRPVTNGGYGGAVPGLAGVDRSDPVCELLLERRDGGSAGVRLGDTVHQRLLALDERGLLGGELLLALDQLGLCDPEALLAGALGGSDPLGPQRDLRGEQLGTTLALGRRGLAHDQGGRLGPDAAQLGLELRPGCLVLDLPVGQHGLAARQPLGERLQLREPGQHGLLLLAQRSRLVIQCVGALLQLVVQLRQLDVARSQHLLDAGGRLATQILRVLELPEAALAVDRAQRDCALAALQVGDAGGKERLALQQLILPLAAAALLLGDRGRAALEQGPGAFQAGGALLQLGDLCRTSGRAGRCLGERRGGAQAGRRGREELGRGGQLVGGGAGGLAPAQPVERLARGGGDRCEMLLGDRAVGLVAVDHEQAHADPLGQRELRQACLDARLLDPLGERCLAVVVRGHVVPASSATTDTARLRGLFRACMPRDHGSNSPAATLPA